MHEYSIVAALLLRVEDEARARSAASVASVRIRLGALSGVEPSLLATAFEMAREGTVCRGADLEIVSGEVSWVCPGCGREGAESRCPTCALPGRLEGGDEILLERIEMEVA